MTTDGSSVGKARCFTMANSSQTQLFAIRVITAEAYRGRGDYGGDEIVST
jgi:hypothetical protein